MHSDSHLFSGIDNDVIYCNTSTVAIENHIQGKVLSKTYMNAETDTYRPSWRERQLQQHQTTYLHNNFTWSIVKCIICVVVLSVLFLVKINMEFGNVGF